MLRNPRRVVLAILLAVLLPFVVAAKTHKVKYDPATETKVSGTIEEVKEFECPVSGTVGYHVTLKVDGGLVMVHIAASRFMKDYQIAFEKGERIEVVGSKVKLENGEDAVLARQITRGQNTYAFRDKQGEPLW